MMVYSLNEFKKIKASCDALKHKYKIGQVVYVRCAFNSLCLYTQWATYERNVYSWFELRQKIQPPEIMTAIIKDRTVRFFEDAGQMVASYDIDFIFEYQGKKGAIQARGYPEQTLEEFATKE